MSYVVHLDYLDLYTYISVLHVCTVVGGTGTCYNIKELQLSAIHHQVYVFYVVYGRLNP